MEPIFTAFKKQYHIFRSLGYWTLLLLPISISVGAVVAFFLWSLDIVTSARWNQPYLILLMPLVGVCIVGLYKKMGKNSIKGNNLIIEEIHQPGGGVPLRMTPLILGSTLLTHLTGGSAGREGTAVQMGGSMAAWFARLFHLHHDKKRILLISGMAAGFSAVFGTPIAGAIFALEVLAIGKIKYEAMLPALMAALIAHFTCISLGISHTKFHIANSPEWIHPTFPLAIDIFLLCKIIVVGIICGWVAYLFSATTGFIKSQAQHWIRNEYLIPVVGAFLVLLISFLLGTYDYLGLGVQSFSKNGISIVNAFQVGGATYFSWWWKLLLTAITLGMGFKGGEVTPLFFIGATLGNTLAILMGAPVDLMAALGFIAVFAGATNTPLACTIMGAELFGADYLVFFAIASYMAYACSGQNGIYKAQISATSKTNFQHS